MLKISGPLTRAFFICIVLLITGCSTNKREPEWNFEVNKSAKDDYGDHFESIGQSFLKTPGTKVISLTWSSKNYLKDIYNRIVKNNELLLANAPKPTFNIIKSDTPFYFSLPKGHFFFSSGLITKYLRNEQLLVAMMSAEIFRSVNSIYEKNIVVPVGYMTLEHILSILKISLKLKSEVNKNSYILLRRAGYDPSAYLVWLQTQNKNMLDFALQHGTSRRMSKEEYLFKNYIASKKDRFEGIEEKNSSRSFYRFLNNIKGRR